MKRTSIAIIIGCSTLASCTGAASNMSELTACDLTTSSKIAAYLNITPDEVHQTIPYTSGNGFTTTCQWDAKQESGDKITIHLRKQERSPKITNPEFFRNNIDRDVRKGRSHAGKHISYAHAELEGVPNGAISEVYGNRYSKSIDYSWHENEERRYTLTFSKTQGDTNSITAPSKQDLQEISLLFEF